MPSPRKRAQALLSLPAIPRLFTGILLVAGLTVLLLAALFLARSRAHYLRQAEDTSQNLCEMLADNLTTSYEKIDLALLSVKEEVERQEAAGHLEGDKLEALIKHRKAWVPALFALRTVNAQGIVEHGDLPPGPAISLRDRSYFLRLQSDPAAGMVFSEPLLGRVMSTWSIMLARRINHSDGSFAGIVYGAIGLGDLGSRFASKAVGQGGVITLRDSDLAVIVRHGGSRDLTGHTAASQAFKDLLKAGHPRGTYTTTTPLDQRARVYAFIHLVPYQQYLNVGLDLQEVLEPWYRELRQTLGFVAAFLLLVGCTYRLVRQAWLHQRSAEQEREQVIHDLQQTLAEVKALRGLLPICSHCKKIRDDQGYWNQIEGYIASHSEAQFTHSICPECAHQLDPDLFPKG